MEKLKAKTYMIISLLCAFILWYMLCVQMQNDMYKVLVQQIEKCNK